MLPAALSLIPSLFQTAMGIGQKRKANRLTQDSYVPPSFQRALGNVRARASKTTAPGYDQAKSNISQSTANTIDSSMKSGASSSQIQQAVAGAGRTQKKALNTLSSENSNYIENADLQLDDMLVQKGRMEQESRDRYSAAKSALRGAGGQNIFNGITSAAEVGVEAYGGVSTPEGSSSSGGHLPSLSKMSTPEFESFMKTNYGGGNKQKYSNKVLKELQKRGYFDESETNSLENELQIPQLEF